MQKSPAAQSALLVHGFPPLSQVGLAAPDGSNISGSDIALDELGSATVTWIIRWDDMAKRNDTMSKAFASGEWQEIMKENPGQENYLRTEAKFAESL